MDAMEGGVCTAALQLGGLSGRDVTWAFKPGEDCTGQDTTDTDTDRRARSRAQGRGDNHSWGRTHTPEAALAAMRRLAQ